MATSCSPPNKTVANLTNQNHLFIFAIEKEMVNIIGHPQGMPLHTKLYTLNTTLFTLNSLLFTINY